MTWTSSESPLTLRSTGSRNSSVSIIDNGHHDHPELHLEDGFDSKPAPAEGTLPRRLPPHTMTSGCQWSRTTVTAGIASTASAPALQALLSDLEAAAATVAGSVAATTHHPVQLQTECQLELEAPVQTTSSASTCRSSSDTGSCSWPPTFSEPSPHGDSDLLEWRLQVIERQRAAAAAHCETFADQLERHMIEMRMEEGSLDRGRKTRPVAVVENRSTGTDTTTGRRHGHKFKWTREGGLQAGSGPGTPMSIKVRTNDITCTRASLNGSRSGSGASVSMRRAGMRRGASSGSLQPEAETWANTSSSSSSLPLSSMSQRYAGGPRKGQLHKSDSPKLHWQQAEGPPSRHHPRTALLHRLVPAAVPLEIELPAQKGCGSGNARSTAGASSLRQRRFTAVDASGMDAGGAGVTTTGFAQEDEPSPAEGWASPTSPTAPVLHFPPPRSPPVSTTSLSRLILNDALPQDTDTQSERFFHEPFPRYLHAQQTPRAFNLNHRLSAQDMISPPAVAGYPHWEGPVTSPHLHRRRGTQMRPSHSNPCLPLSPFLELSPSPDAQGTVTMATGGSARGYQVSKKVGRKQRAVRNSSSGARDGYGESGGLRLSSSGQHDANASRSARRSGVRGSPRWQRSDVVIEGNSSFSLSPTSPHSSTAGFNEGTDLTCGFYCKPRSISRQASSHAS